MTFDEVDDNWIDMNEMEEQFRKLFGTQRSTITDADPLQDDDEIIGRWLGIAREEQEKI